MNSAPRSSRPFAFSRRQRLVTAAQFQAVRRQGRKRSDAFFAVHALRNDVGHARLGVVVSRRVARQAVARNSIKRRVREAFRHQAETLGEFDIVVVAQPRIPLTERLALVASLRQHWEKIQHNAKTPHRSSTGIPISNKPAAR